MDFPFIKQHDVPGMNEVGRVVYEVPPGSFRKKIDLVFVMKMKRRHVIVRCPAHFIDIEIIMRRIDIFLQPRASPVLYKSATLNLP
jgi:hypothetical protein